MTQKNGGGSTIPVTGRILSDQDQSQNINQGSVDRIFLSQVKKEKCQYRGDTKAKESKGQIFKKMSSYI